MAKSYPEQLGAWVELRKSPRRDKNLVAFLAVRDDVQAAIDDGFTVKTVWTNMHEAGRIKFGYHTFRNYVKKHLRAPAEGVPEGHQSTIPKGPTAIGLQALDKAPIAQASKPAASGFTFNAAPNKEELL